MKTKHADWFIGIRGNTVYSTNQNDLKIIVASDVEGEQESAAKLIAAAPELLEACIAVLEALEATHNQRNFNAPMLRKAIQKAIK